MATSRVLPRGQHDHGVLSTAHRALLLKDDAARAWLIHGPNLAQGPRHPLAHVRTRAVCAGAGGSRGSSLQATPVRCSTRTPAGAGKSSTRSPRTACPITRSSPSWRRFTREGGGSTSGSRRSFRDGAPAGASSGFPAPPARPDRPGRSTPGRAGGGHLVGTLASGAGGRYHQQVPRYYRTPPVL